jgi:glutaredoxin-like YruB-family protein
MKKVVVYSQPGCVPCKALKGYLEDLGIHFEDKDITQDEAAMTEVLDMGFRGTPVLVVGDEAIQGFDPDEVKRLLA